jgi:hypothetical protein
LWDKYGAAPDFSEARRQQLKDDRIRQAEEAGVDEANIKSKAEEALLKFYEKHDPAKIAAIDTILDEFELEELAKLLQDKYEQMPDFSQVPGFVYRGINTAILEDNEEEDEEVVEECGVAMKSERQGQPGGGAGGAGAGAGAGGAGGGAGGAGGAGGLGGLGGGEAGKANQDVLKDHATAPKDHAAVPSLPTRTSEQDKITR